MSAKPTICEANMGPKKTQRDLLSPHWILKMGSLKKHFKIIDNNDTVSSGKDLIDKVFNIN